MKTNSIHTTRLAVMAISAALFLGLSGQAIAQTGAKGGGAKLLSLSKRTAVQKSVEPAKFTPMACDFCKDQLVARVDTTARGANKPVEWTARHLCEGCGNKWVVVGHGKTKTTTAIHTCTKSQSPGALCCITSASAPPGSADR